MRRYACSSLLVVVVVLSILSLTQVEAATFTEWTIPTPNSLPSGLVVFGGLVYFTETNGQKIGRLDPGTGVFTEWSKSNADPVCVVVDGGLVYFTEFSGNKIGRLDAATGVFTEWTVPTANSGPEGIFFDSGLVYFAESSGNKIGRLDPATGVFTEWVIPTAILQPHGDPPTSHPFGIVVYGGLVYFTERDGNNIGRLDPATGVFNEWTVPTANSEPYGIFVFGGLVYFIETGGNKVGRLDPATGVFNEWTIPTANSIPVDIVVDSSGLVYFTEQGGHKIGRLDPATGIFIEWAIPTTTSDPFAIAIGYVLVNNVYNVLVYFTEIFAPAPNFDNKIGLLSGIGPGSTITTNLVKAFATTTSQASTASGTNLISATTTSVTASTTSSTQSTASSTTSVGDVFLAPLPPVIPEYPLGLVLLLLALPFSYALVRRRILRNQKNTG